MKKTVDDLLIDIAFYKGLHNNLSKKALLEGSDSLKLLDENLRYVRDEELLKEDQFTKSDIGRLIREGLINIEKLEKETLLKLILNGKIDFYIVSSIRHKIQFNKRELKKIILNSNFNKDTKTGMQNEPVRILNKRTLILYQEKLDFEILNIILEQENFYKTLIKHRKKLIQRARRNNDKQLELYLELL